MSPHPLSTAQLLEHIALGEDSTRQFRRTVQQADTLAAGLVTRTIPDKPNSRLQKYRCTEAGRQQLARMGKEGS